MQENKLLLSYLFENFYEEAAFLEKAHLSAGELSDFTKNRVMPKPSYVLTSKTQSASFVCNHQEDKTYRFHLKGHIEWVHALKNLGLVSEDRAKSHFQAEYDNVAKLFFSGTFGKTLTQITPPLAQAFDDEKFTATWQDFLDGVYGVCTRDGMPKSIFLKQVYVLFINFFTNTFPDPKISIAHREILLQATNLLDAVEADFAPHEVHMTSRQRCIINIRQTYLQQT